MNKPKTQASTSPTDFLGLSAENQSALQNMQRQQKAADDAYKLAWRTAYTCGWKDALTKMAPFFAVDPPRDVAASLERLEAMRAEIDLAWASDRRFSE